MPILPKQPRLTDARAVRAAWAQERKAGRRASTAGDAAGEWDHLERAHILGQPFVVAHVRTHLAMLAYAVRNRDRREIAGQTVRLLVAGPGSAMGRYPLGNTGGANVSATTPMPIPADLRAILRRTETASL